MSSGVQPDGLAGVVAGVSAICTVGLGSGLNYRGYNVKDLTDKTETFEEVAYLLLRGTLPTRRELDAYLLRQGTARKLSSNMKTMLEMLPKDTHPMDVLRVSVSLIGCLEPEPEDPDVRVHDDTAVDVAERLMAVLPCAVLHWFHFSHYGRRIDVSTSKRDPRETMAAHFLRLLHQSGYDSSPDRDMIRTLDKSFICYAEHDYNASTFAARVTTATLSDAYSAFTTAIGTLRGPLHGGANEATMELLSTFENPDDAERKLHEMFSQKKLVMGFGHRIYKAGDPRSPIMEECSRALSQKPGRTTLLFNISKRVEEVMMSEKGMYPNADFYSASAYHYCGFGAPSLLAEPTVSVTDRFGARGFAKKSPPKQKTKEEKQQSAQRKKDLRDRREADKFLSLEDTKSVGSLTPAERRQQRLDQKMEHANMLKEQTQALDEEVKEMKSALQEVQVEQASPELFRSITVAEKPLLSVSQMSIVNATTVNFSVFDDGLAGACQKAIQLRGKNWTISVVLPKVTREVRNECLNRCKGILKKYQRNVNSIKGSMLEENRRMMPSTEMEKTEAAKIEKIYKQRADQLVALLREKEQAMSKAA
ncbi:hypothetical protein FOZ61_007834 [Perkinsus olseni]|uniref:Citrate synthase n=1 Tax=Perkinsus olseni TaxID=32597 RepID=A0A7J6MPZ0_PEROL|nr:hypothetical protein FOZ61_007834 [Perkinsus olseni]KAF4673642.1 hypothetical protein FOL46_006754 [Perkinsus olseni]